MDYSLSVSSVHGILQARILEILLQGIFPTQGLNTGLLHHRQILYHYGKTKLDYLTFLMHYKFCIRMFTLLNGYFKCRNFIVH